MTPLLIEASLTESDRLEIKELKEMLSRLLKKGNEEVWLNDDEVAKRLKVSSRTVQRWVKDGVIPYRKYEGFTRFIPKEVDAWFGKFKGENAHILLKEHNKLAA